MTSTHEPVRGDPPGWLLVHQDGSIASADDGAAMLLRAESSRNLVGRPWTSLLARDEAVADIVEAVRVGTRPWRGLLRFAALDGTVPALTVDLSRVEMPDRMVVIRLGPVPHAVSYMQSTPPESLRARAEALETLYEVDDLRSAGRAVLQTVNEGTPFDWGAVLRFTRTGDRVGAEIVAVYPSNMAGIGPGLRWAPLDRDETEVLASGEPSISTDGGRDGDDRSPLRRLPAFGMRSRIHLPLYGPLPTSPEGGEALVVGCVMLCHHEPGAFGPLEGMRAERLLARLGDRLSRQIERVLPEEAPDLTVSESRRDGEEREGAAEPGHQPSTSSDPEVPPGHRAGDPHDSNLGTLGEIVAGVAHELNNPLTAILGYTQLLGSLADREREQAIRTIEEEAQRAARVVRNLLSFARQGARRAQPVQLDLVLRRVVEVRRYALEVDNIRLLTRFGSVAPVLADESQMEEVLLALLANAHEALREQGGGEVTASVAQIGSHVRVSIADDGPGVPAELRRRIFEPFFTARGAGSGMGLAAVYGIIQEHRGQVWVEASPDGGADFIIELPVAPGATTPGAAPRGESERILVVDDEPPIRALTREILGAAGYEVDVAANGIEALGHIESGAYDLIIADLRMPGMGGADLYDEISHRWPHLQSRVIFITGDMDGEESGRTLARGNVRYLEKPFSTSSLLRTVRQTLDEHRP